MKRFNLNSQETFLKMKWWYGDGEDYTTVNLIG